MTSSEINLEKDVETLETVAPEAVVETETPKEQFDPSTRAFMAAFSFVVDGTLDRWYKGARGDELKDWSSIQGAVAAATAAVTDTDLNETQIKALAKDAVEPAWKFADYYIDNVNNARFVFAQLEHEPAGGMRAARPTLTRFENMQRERSAAAAEAAAAAAARGGRPAPVPDRLDDQATGTGQYL